MIHPAVEGFNDRGSGLEIHVRHPERQDVATGIFLPLLRVAAATIRDGIKVERAHSERSESQPRGVARRFFPPGLAQHVPILRGSPDRSISNLRINSDFAAGRHWCETCDYLCNYPTSQRST